MGKILLSMLWILIVSCQPTYINKSPYTYFKKPEKYFLKMVNPTPTPKSVDLSKTLKLSNPSYPIELALFADGKFYYYLENLGDGFGTWEHKQGMVIMNAERDLFVMKFNIRSIEEEGQRVVLEFQDRFGYQFLELDQG